MKKRFKKESGEVMLESTIAMVIVMLMLVWILGVAFVYYQKYTVRIATNEVAVKIANTYDSPSTDPITAYVSKKDIKSKPLYSGFSVSPVMGVVNQVQNYQSKAKLPQTNQLRADNYMTYIIKKANLFGTVKDVNVTVDFQSDGLGRSHIKVTSECDFKTPFGEALKLFGMSDRTKYRVTSYADSTSISEHISAVQTANAFTNGSIISAGGLIDKVIGMVESFVKAFNAVKN